MDLLLGLAANVMPEPVTSGELYAWKIQPMAWVSFSRENDCQELKLFVEAHLVCLPLSGKTEAFKIYAFCANEIKKKKKKIYSVVQNVQ